MFPIALSWDYALACTDAQFIKSSVKHLAIINPEYFPDMVKYCLWTGMCSHIARSCDWDGRVLSCLLHMMGEKNFVIPGGNTILHPSHDWEAETTVETCLNFIPDYIDVRKRHGCPPLLIVRQPLSTNMNQMLWKTWWKRGISANSWKTTATVSVSRRASIRADEREAKYCGGCIQQEKVELLFPDHDVHI